MFGLFKKDSKKDSKNQVEITMPVNGRCFNISEIPDPTFAEKMLGDGFGFESKDGVIYAPVSGEIATIFPTKHAVIIQTQEGLEVLLHIGIETVALKGEGFEAFVKAGDKVNKGDKLITYDTKTVPEKAQSMLSPLVITNMDLVESMEFDYTATSNNEVVCTVTLNK